MFWTNLLKTAIKCGLFQAAAGPAAAWASVLAAREWLVRPALAAGGPFVQNLALIAIIFSICFIYVAVAVVTALFADHALDVLERKMAASMKIVRDVMES